MHLIKLSAIDSTNSYLKELVSLQPVENFTVVYTQHQTNGRGQLGTIWQSERYKNLTISILIKHFDLNVQSRFYLNMAISLALLETVKKFVKIAPAIKWPNDILADEFKIAGVLIENSFFGEKIRHSIVGLGVNVNQTEFNELNATASSLKKLTGKKIDILEVLNMLVSEIKRYVKILENKQLKLLNAQYLSSLYGYNQIRTFLDTTNNCVFTGKICNVTQEGLLVIETNGGALKTFGLKEIKFI